MVNIEAKLCQLVNSLPDNDHRNFEILSSLMDAYELGLKDGYHRFISSLKDKLKLKIRVQKNKVYVTIFFESKPIIKKKKGI